jgi:hypothetical protein
MKKALAPCRLVRQYVPEPCESRSLLFLYSLSVFPIGNTPFMRFTHSSIVRTFGEYAKRTNEMFSIGKHQVKHRLSFSTRYFLRKYFVRSTNSPCLQAEAFPAKGEDIKKLVEIKEIPKHVRRIITRICSKLTFFAFYEKK